MLCNATCVTTGPATLAGLRLLRALLGHVVHRRVIVNTRDMFKSSDEDGDAVTSAGFLISNNIIITKK